MKSKPAAPLIYLVALEPSGDLLGAKLMNALRIKLGSDARFSGVGGNQMERSGLKSLFDPSDLAILGIFEVLPKASLVIRRVKEVVQDIESKSPSILITIDSWGFTGRVHKTLTKRLNPIPRVRYVAPQVWAWRPGRAKQLSQWIDHLLTLFPFEPPLFETHGLATTYVGHPIIEDNALYTDVSQFRSEFDMEDNAPVLMVLPGSRKSEVRCLTPVFADALGILVSKVPDLHVVIPTIGSVEIEVREWAKSLPFSAHVLTGGIDKANAYATANAAIAASGTVTLELARAGIPHLIAYKVNRLSGLVFRFMAKTKFVNLINILLKYEVVPECLQAECNGRVIAEEVERLLKDEGYRDMQMRCFKDALALLQNGDRKPSEMAADVIGTLIQR
ncbi:MAG: lipid-A-disaccharide synthase [Rhodospirillaceae bacterium]|nr:lipid-A-disaccharide synthase [Rhodospirillaceae bacterium]